MEELCATVPRLVLASNKTASAARHLVIHYHSAVMGRDAANDVRSAILLQYLLMCEEEKRTCGARLQLDSRTRPVHYTR